VRQQQVVNLIPINQQRRALFVSTIDTDSGRRNRYARQEGSGSPPLPLPSWLALAAASGFIFSCRTRAAQRSDLEIIFSRLCQKRSSLVFENFPKHVHLLPSSVGALDARYKSGNITSFTLFVLLVTLAFYKTGENGEWK